MYTEEWKVIVANTEAGSYIGSHASIFKFEHMEDAIDCYHKEASTAEELKETHKVVTQPRVMLVCSDKTIYDYNPDNIELGMIQKWYKINGLV